MLKTFKLGIITTTCLLSFSACSPPPKAASTPALTPSQQSKESESPEHLRFARRAVYQVHHNAKHLKQSAAEIVCASADGQVVFYADSLGGGLGFVDISDIREPKGLGWVPTSGEPTSVASLKQFALLAINEEPGKSRLEIFELATQKSVASHPLPGQPDSVAVSPDKKFVVVVIENEAKDSFPEHPPGSAVIFDVTEDPKSWTQRAVKLEGFAAIHPEDPEPEYVSINEKNQAAISLQENNHILVIDLPSGKVSSHFSAGVVSLEKVDLQDDNRIVMADSRTDVPREPDSVDWSSLGIVLANEGEMGSGGRSFSIFSPEGELLFHSGSDTENVALDFGRYPDSRSDARGTEPESVKVARFADKEFIFVGCERSGLVLVYQMIEGRPQFVQALPASPGPESVTVVPERNLMVIASEVDWPEKDLRSHLSFFELTSDNPEFGHLFSKGIPWSSLSGLTADQQEQGRFYTVTDKALQPNRILTIEKTEEGFQITGELKLSHDGKETDYDLEGISQAKEGGFWLVSEGEKHNTLVKVSETGVVEKEHPLPGELQSLLGKKGFEGVCELDGMVYVAAQQGSKKDVKDHARLFSFDPSKEQWDSVFYPLDKGHSISGLSLGPDNTLAILERDNFARSTAKHKKIFLTWPKEAEKNYAHKIEAYDLLEKYAEKKIPTPRKQEGLAFDGKHFWVVNDNDALNKSYGETVLLEVAGPRKPVPSFKTISLPETGN